MTPQQIGILNSLVTFAAENVPGGLSEEEQEVAQIVGRWALRGKDLRIQYVPIFVGKTEDDEKIVVYKSIDNAHEMHIRRPDGMLWALGPGSRIYIDHGFDLPENYSRLRVTSNEWSGEATGSKIELESEDPIRIM